MNALLSACRREAVVDPIERALSGDPSEMLTHARSLAHRGSIADADRMTVAPDFEQIRRTEHRAENAYVARRTRTELNRRFPKAFVSFGEDKRPLAIGIKLEIRQRASGLDPWHVVLALRDYAGGKSYLAACTEGAPRINLDGEHCGKVSEKEAEYAAKKLAEIAARKMRRSFVGCQK